MNKYEDMSDEDLEQDYRFIEIERSKRRKKKKEIEAQNLCINGITAKDIAVRYGSYDGSGVIDEEDLNYSFFVKHDGKLHCIYYDKGTYDTKHDFTYYPWWPLHGNDDDDEWDRNGAFEFIPPGFGEACENSYEFRGSLADAIERLNKYGITDIEKGDW